MIAYKAQYKLDKVRQIEALRVLLNHLKKEGNHADDNGGDIPTRCEHETFKTATEEF